MVKQQQKLFKRDTCIPRDTSLVSGSMIDFVNKEETLSQVNSKTLNNNLEENLQSGKTEQITRVFVINMRGNPLMPSTPRKARLLLRDKRAKVISCKPFTIQLLYATGESKQEATLGIDTGAKTIGYSVITKTKELISGEFQLRIDVSKKIQDKAMYRRTRRNRLWHRKPRFLNRTKSKCKGWLAPSIQHKIDSHMRLIDKIKYLIPISKVIIESTTFDAHKLQNPDIEGTEYQEGQMQGFENVKMFVRQRDKYTCQICKKKDDNILDVHHIIQRKDGGSDRPDNLITLHQSCHKKFHLGKIKHQFTKPKSFKETSVMNSLWSRLKDLVDCSETFGYITKCKRNQLGLSKSHYNDAFVIAGGTNQERCFSKTTKQIRRNNRKLQTNRKGFKVSIRKQRYTTQPNDVMLFEGNKYKTKGLFNYGNWIRMVDNLGNIINKNIKLTKLIYYGKGIEL